MKGKVKLMEESLNGIISFILKKKNYYFKALMLFIV
jgi:hypothetical protein